MPLGLVMLVNLLHSKKLLNLKRNALLKSSIFSYSFKSLTKSTAERLADKILTYLRSLVITSSSLLSL
jgi:hypothetical protein